ncbi:hypothetical protein [Amycolatopsis sp. FDAARGOS 1241]|uniref:hypothetical protein n=1 Tax=Amycolatopsis sp. FDAARGOS 1241 TaxID=2778070 RepID=UPI00194E40F2|nr:hypothetical protein [Amycolatopsis sp. FDAARGOS 1241]QRP49403.1 hypothetical protein I6J71_17550 [Amycolatopsis sp. FDAARGOS 1241]
MTTNTNARRPAISRRDRHRRAEPAGSEVSRWARQPWLGVAGLSLVIPVAVLLAVAAGGAEGSLLVFAPLVTFSLPVVAMIAFWWEDWPGTRLGPDWAGWADTVLIAVGAVVFTALGSALVGHFSLAAVFDPFPRDAELGTFPATMPLAGAAFVAMLQLTLVSEHWPVRRFLGPIAGGVASVVLAWVVALVLWMALLGGKPFHGEGHGVLTGGQFGAVLTCVGAWQVWLFVLWRGWPFRLVPRQGVRFACANVVSLGGGILTYIVLAVVLGVAPAGVTTMAGDFVAGGLLVGMLFEDAFPARWPAGLERAVSLALTLVVAAGLHFALLTVANSLAWSRSSAIDWVGHVTLNAVGTSVILHVAIGRRWPFGRRSVGGQET